MQTAHSTAHLSHGPIAASLSLSLSLSTVRSNANPHATRKFPSFVSAKSPMCSDANKEHPIHRQADGLPFCSLFQSGSVWSHRITKFFVSFPDAVRQGFLHLPTHAISRHYIPQLCGELTSLCTRLTSPTSSRIWGSLTRTAPSLCAPLSYGRNPDAFIRASFFFPSSPSSSSSGIRHPVLLPQHLLTPID